MRPSRSAIKIVAFPDSQSKRSNAALARQSRISVHHEAIEEAKGKAELRRKVEEFVEMLSSEDMSVKVTSAAMTPPKEAVLQQIKTCAKYCWSDEECSIHIRCALISDAAMLVWSQLDPDGLSYQQLRTLLRERYGSAKQEEKYQAELRVRRRKIGEELPRYGRI